MAGHSKWANIKHRKAAADSKKGKVFTRLIKEITVAAKAGGGDPAMNPRLRLSLEKAREANMTNDSVRRAIQRGTGELEGTSYDEVRYEGYGPGGAAVLLDCLTDNRTRTVAEVRHAFVKNGGNLGSDGSVAYLFKHCGQFIFAPGTSAEDVMKHDDGSVELICAPLEFDAVKAALEKAKLKAELAEITMKPVNESALTGDEAARMRKLLEALESLDDLQEVYTTAVLD
jgi:YebC/PmpR family DNA-binding regulatory protein